MNKPKIMPTTYFLIALLVIPILNFLLPIIRIVPSPWNLPGILFILVGIVIELAADRLFQQAGTSVKPGAESQALVTNGVFRISRNPMYLGFALILFGAAALFGTLTPFLVVPVFMVLIRLRFIQVEEMMLEHTFGTAYLDFKNQIRRWI